MREQQHVRRALAFCLFGFRSFLYGTQIIVFLLKSRLPNCRTARSPQLKTKENDFHPWTVERWVHKETNYLIPNRTKYRLRRHRPIQRWKPPQREREARTLRSSLAILVRTSCLKTMVGVCYRARNVELHEMSQIITLILPRLHGVPPSLGCGTAASSPYYCVTTRDSTKRNIRVQEPTCSQQVSVTQRTQRSSAVKLKLQFTCGFFVVKIPKNGILRSMNSTTIQPTRLHI